MTQTARNRSEPGLGQLGSADTEVPDWFARYFEAALSNPLLYVPKAFETWMTDRVAVAGLDVPIGQIVGFSQYTALSASVETLETTTSTSYTDLATVGPKLSGIPDGSYLIFHGCAARNTTAGDAAFQSIQTNSTAAADSDLAGVNYNDLISVARVAVKTLSNGGNNEITCKYRANGGGTAGFARRWIVALRYANA